MKLEFRPTTHEADIRCIASTPREIELAADILPDDFLAVILPRRTRGGTWFAKDRPVIAGGFTTVRQGIEYAWLISAVDLKPYIRQIWPIMKRYVTESSGKVITGMTNGQEAAIRVVRRLGFVPGDIRTMNSRLYYLKDIP